MKLHQFLTVFVLFHIDSLSRNYVSSQGSTETSFEESICQTMDCYEAANRIEEGIDYTTSPCDDFYQFSCGNWLKNMQIPEERSWWSVWAISRLKLKLQMKELLEKNQKSKIYRSPVIKKMINFYRDCINIKRREQVGIEPILDILRGIGGWPMVQKSWSKSGFNWFNAYKTLKSHYGVNYLIKIYIEVDLINNTQRSLYIGSPDFEISSEFGNKGFEKTYKKFMRSVINLMSRSAALSRPVIDRDIDELYDFEYRLVSLLSEGDHRKDHLSAYRRVSISSLSRNYRGLNWRTLLNSMFRVAGIDFSSNDYVIVEDHQYLKKLVKLIRSTPERILANYFGWKIALSYGEYTTIKFQTIRFKYQKTLKGLKRPEKLWESCYSVLDTYFHFAMGRLYVDSYFDSSKISKVETLIRYIKEALRGVLNQQTWMDPLTRKRAKQKLNNQISIVAYQPWIRDNEQLEDYYQDVSIIPGNFIRTILNFEKIDVGKKFQALKYQVNRHSVRLSGPAIVNAFNYFDLNYVQFPAAILQPPFFSENVPDALNFGAIGKTIGHEIIHSFDDEGKQYDKDGNLRNWWSSGSTERYNEKAQCFVDQYDQMIEPETGLSLNGFNTQGENIADNGGINIAFRGFKKYTKKARNVRNERLPGNMSQFSPDQLFFLSFASIWCEKERVPSLKSSILQGVHSPSRFRVTGSLINNQHFAQAFNCPIDSPMNPSSKCKLW